MTLRRRPPRSCLGSTERTPTTTDVDVPLCAGMVRYRGSAQVEGFAEPEGKGGKDAETLHSL